MRSVDVLRVLAVAMSCSHCAQPGRSAASSAPAAEPGDASAPSAQVGVLAASSSAPVTSPSPPAAYLCARPYVHPGDECRLPLHTVPERGWTHPLACPCGVVIGPYGAWPPLCSEPGDAGDVALALWLPPAPVRQPSEAERDAYTPTWPSAMPPQGLAIALVRSGSVHYGVNVFADGRTMVQAMMCPLDHHVHTGSIAQSDVERLLAAARTSRFADATDAYRASSESELVGVAVYDHGTLKFAYGCTGAEPEAQPLLHLADLIDLTVGTGPIVH